MARSEQGIPQGPERRHIPQGIDFHADVEKLAEQLSGKVVGIEGGSQIVRFDEVEAWPLEERANLRSIGARYRKVLQDPNFDIQPGTIWTPPIRSATNFQMIVAAYDNGAPGACVRVARSSRYDATSKQYIPLKNETDTARYLGLERDELAQLEQTENSNILHIVRTGQFIDRAIGRRVSSVQNANALLEDLLR